MVVNVKKVTPGTEVMLHTKKGDFSCVILESPSPEIILVKLKSGYNIGVKEEDILDLKVIRKKEEKETSKKSKGKEDKKKINNDLPNVVLIATGGTISSRLDYKTGGVKWLSNPQELLKVYPELLKICNISKIEVPFMKASENMDSSDWSKISEVAVKHLNDNKVDGIIITHGTDFLAYSAAALGFSLRNLNKPVVLTYSQRSSDRASSDARLNLVCAARAAVSDIAEVMLVGHGNSNDEFCYALRGSKVRKMHTSRRDTFRPINSKPIAKVYPERIEIISEYKKRNNNKVELKNKFSDKVALVKFYPGQDPEILEHYQAKGYRGVVIEMSGLGHVLTGESKNNWLPKLRKVIREGMIVCAAPQTLYGRLDPWVYSVGRELQSTGIIYLEDILPETALVKLSWVLANIKPINQDKVKEAMLTNMAGEFNSRLTEEEFLN
ncbi:Glu-tRNA(Gln) amidotransferase subunit GatD [Candidatus Pacearchaeota archaeon]|nr:Glu-tRNA(Gln) amidotransferase subunit GatD [Candidatus Pacearchaeota archaeon]